MSIELDILSTRTVSENLPISIGSGQALEGFTALLQKPNAAFWINLRTVIRNAMESISKDYTGKYRPKDLMHVVTTDITFMLDYLRNSLGVSDIQLYYCMYDDFRSVFPHALAKDVKTPLQIAQQSMEVGTLKLCVDYYKDAKRFGTLVTGEITTSVIMITHMPIDLLKHKTFSQLWLLESHTGALKGKSEFYTKLTNGKDLTMIPFNKFTIQIFGDNNRMLQAMPNNLKKLIIDLATKHRWTPLTTMELVKFHINTITDMYTRDVLLKIARS